ncbi:Enoyl-CoA hydratase [Pseudonocardia sp. Ae406_Ps2]|uniref:enoyl-CoA hydratase n=1 Tax=unclassified Pseudonocardia TaxID=2619320 RepID=UPI00094ACD31|nr:MULTISPECIES: enoyl-CoA hydratase [unclassified Pseudonocardia]OLL97747.1 Enoyl-CoA hydratase [Pseudonocardia sp. Ae331_Ps2]OLM04538.1 Enoyl-CoA hydratase [Pseudonocardia sp. Ae406_Ps2]OLM10627.1 Enoyl-CoA hydratase [Pseudonocardia sp. Ae505_Ps2]OLM26109.1 Enoyl-CoA hydratase [Pseudonocardia sp. Ae706_Ps2]OLM33777.1 Enoyl-CoA hydratase [Pseudonocardia sp. Ae717_Ps2]
MSDGDVTTEVRTEVTDGVAVLTVSNPARRNALNLDLSQKLVAAVEAANADDSVGAIVVTGQEPAFCAGGDLAELQQADPATLKRVYSGFLAIASSPLPTLAAVNGAAVGAGINLALACDVRLAGPTARFDVRFMQLGLHPGGGYTWMAQRALGAQGSAAMTLFGDVLDAREAERVGLVWRAYDSDEDLMAGARELAGRAAAAPRDLIVTTKATMRITARLDAHADATDIEVRAQAETVHSEAFAERVAALQKKISRK